MKETVLAFCAGTGVGVLATLFALFPYNNNNSEKQKRNAAAGGRPRQVPRGNIPMVDAIARPNEIKELENNFFHGMNIKMALSPDQIVRLKDYLRGQLNNQNQAVFNDAQTLEDVLKSMRDIDVIHARNPGSYMHIDNILQNAGIDARPIIWNIGRLADAVRDLNDGNRPIYGFEADIFEFDAVIIHCEDDRGGVKGFINMSTENLNVPNLSLCTLEDFNTSKPQLQSLSEVFQRARYVFVYVTCNLTRDTFVRFMTEMALTESLQDPCKKYRIIPIWATAEHVTIIELQPLPGLKYHRYFDDMSRASFVEKLQRFFIKGRGEIVQA